MWQITVTDNFCVCSIDEIEESGDDESEDNNEQEADENEAAKDEWSKIKDDDLIQPEKLLELKSKESHVVHCPYFPQVTYFMFLSFGFISIFSFFNFCLIINF